MVGQARTFIYQYFFTHYLAAMGIVDGEVVHHLGVYCCHGNYWGVVVRLISHWSLQRDDGTVVLYFNGNQWRTKTSYRDREKIFSFWYILKYYRLK